MDEILFENVHFYHEYVTLFFPTVYKGSKIDLGHHFGLAAHALNDLVAFNDAIAVGKNMLDLDETLITVTADHSHMFGFGGYAPRGTPILGKICLSYYVSLH